MTRALFTLCFVCGAPAYADVAIPQPSPQKTWQDGCVVRIDEAVKRVGLSAGARITLFPLLREDGTPSPVRYVQYGSRDVELTVGEETEQRPDSRWVADGELNRTVLFRRYHGRFARMFNTENRVLKAALDDCLKMGESK